MKQPLTTVTLYLLLLLASAVGHGADYDPLAVSAEYTPRIVDLTVRDTERDHDIPIQAYLPQATRAAPMVLFSHGLGGSREENGYLGRHWAARGYVTVFLQHPGSDASVWQDEAPGRRMQAMRKAASARNFLFCCE